MSIQLTENGSLTLSALHLTQESGATEQLCPPAPSSELGIKLVSSNWF